MSYWRAASSDHVAVACPFPSLDANANQACYQTAAGPPCYGASPAWALAVVVWMVTALEGVSTGSLGAPPACCQNSVACPLQAIVVACGEIGLAFQRNVSVAGAETQGSCVVGGDAAAASQEKLPLGARRVP